MTRLADREHEGLGYVLYLTVDGNCLVVRQTGRLPNLSEARRVQKWVAEECARHGLCRLVIDNRQTEAPDPHVRDDMRQWIQNGTYQAVGFVLESDLLRVGVNMDALQAGRRVRAFSDVSQALRWAERHRSSPVSAVHKAPGACEDTPASGRLK